METLEQIKARVESTIPGSRLQIVPNGAVPSQASLLLDNEHAVAVARFLRDDPSLRLDYLSNAVGVDWPERVIKEKRKVTKTVDGVTKEVEETVEQHIAPYLEAVYHLYSMTLKAGPVIVRLRTGNRTDKVTVPSLTPVWRSGEFQEREIFDLFGIQFEGHPDLRRILMWPEFTDYPMRKDYVAPDDYEYEPTPHDEVLVKSKKHSSSSTKEVSA